VRGVLSNGVRGGLCYTAGVHRPSTRVLLLAGAVAVGGYFLLFRRGAASLADVIAGLPPGTDPYGVKYGQPYTHRPLLGDMWRNPTNDPELNPDVLDRGVLRVGSMVTGMGELHAFNDAFPFYVGC